MHGKRTVTRLGGLPFHIDRFSNALVGCILAVLRAGRNEPLVDDDWDPSKLDRELFDRADGRSREHGPSGRGGRDASVQCSPFETCAAPFHWSAPKSRLRRPSFQVTVARFIYKVNPACRNATSGASSYSQLSINFKLDFFLPSRLAPILAPCTHIRRCIWLLIHSMGSGPESALSLQTVSDRQAGYI